jgi:hypothetical protein
LSWDEARLKLDPIFISHRKEFIQLESEAQRAVIFRPYCAAFKPLIIVRALENYVLENEWLLWSDSSHHNRPEIFSDVRDATIKLSNSGIDATWGLSHCSENGMSHVYNNMSHGSYPHVSNVTLFEFKHLLKKPREFLDDIMVLNTHILIKNNDNNRAIAKLWLNMALENSQGFCNSHLQDQSALSMLVYNLSLPRISTCRFGSTEREDKKKTSIDRAL